jgi:peroxiredoxin
MFNRSRLSRRILPWVAGATLMTVALLVVVARSRASPSFPEASSELALGTALSEAPLLGDDGKEIHLSSFKGRPTVILVVRSGLCASCESQLKDLAAQVRSSAEERPLHVLAITKDPPSINRQLRHDAKIPFALLSDEQAVVSNQLCNGRAHCLVVADAHGAIRWGVLSDNWRKPPPTARALAAAYAL